VGLNEPSHLHSAEAAFETSAIFVRAGGSVWRYECASSARRTSKYKLDH